MLKLRHLFLAKVRKKFAPQLNFSDAAVDR